MNYSNMIEEKNLKKTFIIATLCSTLVGTFTSSMGLWDRVKEKRKQQHRDTTQDDDIKKLKAYVERSEKRDNEQDRAIARRDRDEVGASFQRSGALISREFEDGYERLGRDFAVGDVITENRLQAQVIALQQTVINVLQDALYHGRPLDRADMAKLVAASDAARDGSLGALREQRQRLLMATEETQRSPQPQLALGPPRRASTISSSQSQPQLALGPPRRASTIVSSHSQPQLALGPPRRPSPTASSRSHMALGPPRRASTIVKSDPLFCRYSLDLQYVPSKPLAASFAPGGDCQCPACGIRLAVESDDCWAIGKRASRMISVEGYKREIDEDVEFIVDQRFVVKCHTEDGEYACVLCSRYRDGDVICATADALVNHVGRTHDITELEREPDFQVRSRELEKGL
ncbi:hypothetical protein QQX98_011735 [Neonectria punicea]|uniref:Uncharacterized protein n=1 Tax=Neonectria punicea TaxID=979145 RepID=A0ABR1GL77_9HYPO